MRARLRLAALSTTLLAACPSPSPSSSSSSSSSSSPPLAVSRLLSDSDSDPDSSFARALAPRPFVFPADDGPHPTFRSEWWYFTGIVRAGARRFGYELTIFRRALAASAPARGSAWATRDAFMADFALTDVDGASGAARFHADERFARDGLGLAGARAQPFAVWVDDWRMDGPADGASTTPIRLVARADSGAAIDLVVDAAGAPVAQGDRGLSAKGPRPGEASYYYSRTRLPTRGRVTLPAAGARAGAAGAPPPTSWQVSGQSWMDREWSTGSLAAGVSGWDWLGVHLSDGRDLMLYRLRDAGGRATRESRLTLIQPDGATQHWRADEFTLTPTAVWQSPHSGARYPIGLRLDVPRAELRLDVRALQDDQELRFAVTYWEGAVALHGTSAGAAITGEGYLELTGYPDGQRQP